MKYLQMSRLIMLLSAWVAKVANLLLLPNIVKPFSSTKRVLTSIGYSLTPSKLIVPYIDEVPANVTFDHAFECVGGKGSQSAVNQIIDLVSRDICRYFINMIDVLHKRKMT
jgi:hypothetical protein